MHINIKLVGILTDGYVEDLVDGQKECDKNEQLWMNEDRDIQKEGDRKREGH